MDFVDYSNATRHLSELLDRVEAGERITITKQGKPIAQLVPVTRPADEVRNAVIRLRERRKRLKGIPHGALRKITHEDRRYQYRWS